MAAPSVREAALQFRQLEQAVSVIAANQVSQDVGAAIVVVQGHRVSGTNRNHDHVGDGLSRHEVEVRGRGSGCAPGIDRQVAGRGG
jgi:hypothetical protein